MLAQVCRRFGRSTDLCGSMLHRTFAAFGSSMPSPTKLEAIVNMDKMIERTPDQIAALWQEVTSCFSFGFDSVPEHPGEL